ncbi:MAG: hypothetical protein IM638_00870 [Bacteroidetes bacterium]|nr:hypothetical protein [Bacteroidota bacterium]
MNPNPINNLDPLDKECYTTLKNEFIQIFNSFRLLFLYQIAGFVALVYSSSKTETVLSSFLICLFMIILTWICNNIGKIWVSQAVRQVSYTFVAFELPRYKYAQINTEDKDYEKETRGLWILANRVEKNTSGTNAIKKEKNGLRIRPINQKSVISTYVPASEIKLFYQIQIVYIFFSGIIFYAQSCLLFDEAKVNSETVVTLGSIFGIIYLISLYYFLVHYRDNKNIINDATMEWINYFNNKKNYDKKYTRENYNI